jgi:hypothetical protein
MPTRLLSESTTTATTTSKGVVELAMDGEDAAGVVVQGDDGRLSDAREPTAHAASHATGGTDAITAASIDAEPELGNPATNGFVLSSTTAGVRSWIEPAAGAAWGDITGTPTTLAGYGITDAASDTELTTHAADTTSIHGIADTSVLATATDLATEIATHAADTTAVHGIADTSVLATATDVATAVSAHTSDATAAHAASAISFTPNGSIAATDVQAAIQEVRDEAASGGVTTLAALTDVDLTGLASSDILQWNGTDWVPVDMPAGGGSVATDALWDAAGDLAVGSGANTAARLAIGTDGQKLTSDGTTATWEADYAALAFVIDGGGAAITTGIKGDLEVPFACAIERVTLLADASGSIVVDIWRDSYANYPPVDADSITAAAPPTISAATKSQDATLTGWTTTLAAGDILRFNVDSAATVQRLLVSLRVRKT